jgi:hypothetical protein
LVTFRVSALSVGTDLKHRLGVSVVIILASVSVPQYYSYTLMKFKTVVYFSINLSILHSDFIKFPSYKYLPASLVSVSMFTESL